MKQRSLVNARRVLTLAACACFPLGLVGCSDAIKAENNRLLAENSELRGKMGQYENALGTLEAERAQLAGEVTSLQGELSSRPTPQSAGSTGFSGIDGVNEVRVGGSGEVVVGIAGDVLFDSGKATLKSDAKRTLERVAGVIKSRYDGSNIRVEGYSDSDPIKKSAWKTNERLSGERAMAVESFLVSKGVPNDSIYFAGFGPALSKATKKESRRVEIVIIDRR